MSPSTVFGVLCRLILSLAVTLPPAMIRGLFCAVSALSAPVVRGLADVAFAVTGEAPVSR